MENKNNNKWKLLKNMHLNFYSTYLVFSPGEGNQLNNQSNSESK